jgi:hypothetical protein
VRFRAPFTAEPHANEMNGYWPIMMDFLIEQSIEQNNSHFLMQIDMKTAETNFCFLIRNSRSFQKIA